MSFPVVSLESVPPQGLDVPVAAAWSRADAEVAMEGPLDAVSGALHVTREGKDLVVVGTIVATASVGCGRCARVVPLTVRADVDCLYLSPRPDDAPDPETSHAELGEYDGVALDLAHVVGESLALERPARVLCADVDPAEDAACLARWRAATATPEPDGPVDPRFALLHSLKFPNQE